MAAIPKQKPNYGRPSGRGYNIPNTGMVVVNDIGDLKDIHPTNKQDVGHRLALLALANTYGRNNLVCSGPAFQIHDYEGDKLRVTFDHADGGLASRDGSRWTGSKSLTRTKVDSSRPTRALMATPCALRPGSEHPMALRFAWSGLAQPNLMNSEGLPAGAFRTGSLPNATSLA